MKNASTKFLGLFAGMNMVILSMAVLLSGCADPTEGVQNTEGTEAQVVVDVVGRDYAFDKESSIIEFAGTKEPGITHMGGWSEFQGKVTLAGDDLSTGSISFEIEIDSMNSDDKDLTATLLSEKMFDVENFPKASFASTAIVKNGEMYAVSGNFTLRGVTKNITFDVTVTVSDTQVTAESEFVLNRKDFGLNYDGVLGAVIRDKVVMVIYIEANVVKEADAAK